MTSKILVVDDDPHIRDVVRTAFAKAGFTVFTADNGRSGLKVFKAEQPDLVITDILMPVMEGIETILELKRTVSPPKVIAISGGGRVSGNDFLKWALHLGADKVVLKPFRMSTLISTARELLDDDLGAGPSDPEGGKTPQSCTEPARDRAGLGEWRFQHRACVQHWACVAA